jgi:hypothetical protein
MQERRNGITPIPLDPEQYINELQVHGLIILKKFGWNLVCVRRCRDHIPAVILNSRREGRVGVLQDDGILKIKDELMVRGQTKDKLDISKGIVKPLSIKFVQCSHAGWIPGRRPFQYK